MSDQALAWKAGFGALVLAFSAATYVTRKHPETPGPAANVPVAAQTFAAAGQPAEPASLDVQEDAPPVRVQVTLHEPDRQPAVRAQSRAQTRGATQRLRPAKTPPPRVHVVVAKRKASPYAIGSKHYPYNPRERWAARDAP